MQQPPIVITIPTDLTSDPKEITLKDYTKHVISHGLVSVTRIATPDITVEIFDLGNDTPTPKMDKDTRRQLAKDLHACGVSEQKIADTLNVSQYVVSDYVR